MQDSGFEDEGLRMKDSIELAGGRRSSKFASGGEALARKRQAAPPTLKLESRSI
jgi:hypothetical protein